MTQVASPQAVLGPFDDVDLHFEGHSVRLERVGDQFWAEMNDPDVELEALSTRGTTEGIEIPRVRKQIVMTTGSHKLQAYWTASRHGRELIQFPFVYVIDEQRWIPNQTSFLQPPDALRLFPVWNNGCIHCHTLGGQRKFHPDYYWQHSQVAELGISCESCHGAGEEHIRLHRSPLNRYQQHLSDERDPSIVNPKDCSAQRATHICARCHSHSLALDLRDEWGWVPGFRPGEDLHASRSVLQYEPRSGDSEGETTEAGRFWPDGTGRIGGREFNGLMISSCYVNGDLSCLSCHSMHQSDPDNLLAANMSGNQACLQCHEEFGNRLQEHTHHAPSSSGSLCYNCHMPHTSYALLAATRSHRIDSPHIRDSHRGARPNACNLCHLDRTLAWSAEHLSRWYGQPTPQLDDTERQIAASILWLLKGNAVQRAVTLWAVTWSPAQEASGSDWQTPLAAQLLDDPYAVVRLMAGRTLQSLAADGAEEYDFLAAPTQRQSVISRIVSAWSAGRRARGDSSLLLDRDGRIQQDVVDRLMEHRDDQPIMISE